ncbi:MULTISPECIES: hypothetical protein [Acinetobacter]|uniref:hypothetical protein n=1 Tax=Acinetobacter TaxID=469 RepID=UPI00044C05C9|nr:MULTISPECIES: hypothetical protein [Acinetobacter]EXD37048.1 putative membrane protein [Acinetobacter sp. 479375]MCH2015405.1 hypothetical protein [Acinetobacter ursingii]MCU4524231.1 hypothetical protein [Acinetobacter ursingii]MCU4588206.1 hypothetical protein [Acinetobacter ursingii]RSO84600.1 hypothetical protein EA748_04705 [Acinetobacter ursingii]
MLLKFATRFMGILVAVLIVFALGIHFLFPAKLTIDLWIIVVPLILGFPIVFSVLLAKDDELNRETVN